MKKIGQFQKHIFQKLICRCPSNLVCKVVYTEAIKYVKLIEISLVVREIRGVENGNLVVPVNNTLVCRMSSRYCSYTLAGLCKIVAAHIAKFSNRDLTMATKCVGHIVEHLWNMYTFTYIVKYN